MGVPDYSPGGGAAGWLSRLLGAGSDATVPNDSGTADPKTSAEINELLDEYQTDINRQNLITLGRDFSPDDLKNYRNRARFGDPRFLYAMYDEMIRLGPGAQRTVAVEAMKSARPQFVTSPEDWDDDSHVPEDANPVDVANARAARDFIEDTLHPHLEELIANHALQEFYGLADSKITLSPRGNSGRWDSIESVQDIPARRHRLDIRTHEWMLMLSPDSWEGQPVSGLELRNDGGTEGLFFTEIGAGSTHLDQRGLLFQCLVPWNLQQYTIRWRAKYTELFGVPTRMAFVDFGHPNRVAEARKSLKNMGATAYGVFHTGTDVKLLEAHTSGTNDPFSLQIEWIDRIYDQIILGHSQMTGLQKGVGGKMAGATASEQFQDLTNSRLRTLSSQMTRKLGKTLIARNFGAKIAEQNCPIIKLRFVERDDPELLSKVALTLKQAGAGEAVGVEDLVRRCAMKIAAVGDKNLGAAGPEAGPAAGVGATAGGGSAVGAHGLPLSAAESRQALQALAMADSSEYAAIRKVVEGYIATEKKRAIEYGKRRLREAGVAE